MPTVTMPVVYLPLVTLAPTITSVGAHGLGLRALHCETVIVDPYAVTPIRVQLPTFSAGMGLSSRMSKPPSEWVPSCILPEQIRSAYPPWTKRNQIAAQLSGLSIRTST